MGKFSQKIKSLLPLTGTILFFLFFVTPISLKASDCRVIFGIDNTSSIIAKEITEEIRSYLMSHSFIPVLRDSDIEYEIINIFENSGIVYVLGELSQEENCLLTLFSIEKGWFSTTTKMLYMTTDIIQTPLLFRDVCSIAETALAKSPSNYHVLIQKFEGPQLIHGGHLQIWSFYNLLEWIDLMVLTIPTLDGGTDIAVLVPK